ncbi:CDGP domain-containing protein [Mycolicibacterium vaccae]|uniref:CDGP domain-containing protein n=1 Tax=Mycolicibacterium vaccae TaxID=1810 RepID=UPI003CEA07A1
MATSAQAQPDWASPGTPQVGCETIDWGLFGSQQRTICDGPRRFDGSWERLRIVWTPAGYVPRSTYCGTYSCTSSGGYYREESLQARESYIVFDHNIVPGEPGWLPPGTDIIR